MEKKNLRAFAKTVREIVKRSDCDRNLIDMMLFHFANLKKDFDPKRCTRDDYLMRLISLMFVNQMHRFITPPNYETDVDENKGWMIPPVPVDLFSDTKASVSYRRNVFFQCLKELDILECTVASVSENILELKVMHKYRVPEVLFNLDIYAQFSKEGTVTRYLQYDFVRVVVSGINRIVGEKEDPEIWVTDNYTDLPVNKRSKLGKINWNEMPFYVCKPPDAKRFPSYTDYLKGHPSFHNHLWIYELFNSNFGVDQTSIFSMLPTHAGLKFPEVEALQEKLTELKLDDAQKLFESANDETKTGNLDQALLDVNTAIDECPKTDLLASKLCFLRAKIYELKFHPKLNHKCLDDLVDALTLNPNKKLYLDKLVYQLSVIACLLYYHKDYEKAALLAEICLGLDKDNSNVLLLQERLEAKKKELQVNLGEKVSPRKIESPEKRATKVSPGKNAAEVSPATTKTVNVQIRDK